MQKNAVLILSWVLYTLVLSFIWYFRLQSLMTVGLAIIGSLIGFILPIVLDILLPKMMNGSAEVTTTFAKDVLQESAGQLKQGNVHSTSVPKTPLRSYPLLLAYVIATVFVITSTQNWFGRGFVVGLGFSLIADIFLSRQPTLLRERWFSVFRTTLTDTELRFFVWIVSAVFVGLSFLAAVV